MYEMCEVFFWILGSGFGNGQFSEGFKLKTEIVHITYAINSTAIIDCY